MGVCLLFKFLLLFSFLLPLDQRFLEEVKILEVNAVALRKHELWLRAFLLRFREKFLKRIVVLFVVSDEFLVGHTQSIGKFDCDFLLFKKDELVVLHVVLCVGF